MIKALDFPALSALHRRHDQFAQVEGAARRCDPAYGVFAAIDSASPSALADLGKLIARYGDVALLEAEPPRQGPGFTLHSDDLGVQMVAETLSGFDEPAFDIVQLGKADHDEMLALATLTQPGPFFSRTPLLGDFFGVKADGMLVAMAGERMKPEGATEVSGVCTHPQWRGKGYAGALMRKVAQRILDRGEIAFLHAYASNHGAIALYESLGFTIRRTVSMVRLTRAI